MAIVDFISDTQTFQRSSKDTAMIIAFVAFLFLTFWPMVAFSFPDGYLMHAREPLITQAPRIDDHPLFARGGVSTCGFISGDASMSPSSPSFSPSDFLLT